MDRDVDFLIYRATPLIFGVFGHIAEDDGKQIVKVGGSGIFVAPFIAITARHVSRELLKMDWRGEHPPSKGYFETQHSSGLFQIHEPYGMTPSLAMWQVNRVSDTNDILTDITLMQVAAEGGAALDMQKRMPTQFFEWSLLPPPVGAQVVMLGYPKATITPHEGDWDINSQIVSQVGQVSDVYETRRERGMLNFPCFRIDKPVDHGFSGGPVFWGDKLCGIVSSGGIDDETYAATLWPFCLLEYEYPDLGSLGVKTTVGDLFEKGVLKSADWPILRHRISRQYDDDGAPYVHINDEAA